MIGRVGLKGRRKKSRFEGWKIIDKGLKGRR